MPIPSSTSTRQLIRVGHSPDPDDAFMFHALANGKLDTGPYEFNHELVDIESCSIASQEVNEGLARLRSRPVYDGDYTVSENTGGRFFEQTNNAVAQEMLDLATRLVKPGQSLLVDAYCGAGFFAAPDPQRDAAPVRAALQAGDAAEAAGFADRPGAEAVGAPVRDVVRQLLRGLLVRTDATKHDGEHARIGFDGAQVGQVSAAHRRQHQARGAQDPQRVHGAPAGTRSVAVAGRSGDVSDGEFNEARCIRAPIERLAGMRPKPYPSVSGNTKCCSPVGQVRCRTNRELN